MEMKRGHKPFSLCPFVFEFGSGRASFNLKKPLWKKHLHEGKRFDMEHLEGRGENRESGAPKLLSGVRMWSGFLEAARNGWPGYPHPSLPSDGRGRRKLRKLHTRPLPLSCFPCDGE